jgi:hypothetical protein
MAYWTIDFKTFLNETVHILIEKSGNVNQALTPSDNPLNIEEEGKDNLFVPLKTQSGYIEFMCDDLSIIDEIIPTHGGTRRVYVYNTTPVTSETTPMWVGYVQPKLLTFTMWMGKQKVKIPIECRLSGLKYKKMPIPSSTTVSIAEIMQNILGSRFDIAIFQGLCFLEREATQTKDRIWRWKRINSTLLNSDMSMYDVLEKICTFFGWTCRTSGIDVYFILHRNVDADTMFWQQIHADKINDQEEFARDWANDFWSESLITETMLCNSSNTIKFFEGISEAIATCSLQLYDMSVNMDYSYIGLAIDDGRINPAVHESENHWSEGAYQYSEYDLYIDQFNNVDCGDFYVGGYNVKPYLDKKGSQNAAEWEVSLNVIGSAHYKQTVQHVVPSDPAESRPYDLTSVTVYQEYHGVLNLTSKNVITFPTAGTIKMDVKMRNVTFPHGATSTAYAYIKIDDKWYNPDTGQWQTAKPSSYMVIEQNKDKDLTYNIYVPGLMTGLLVIEFVQFPVVSYSTCAFTASDISGVTLDFEAEQNEAYSSNFDTSEYVKKNNSGFEKTLTFNSDICLKSHHATNSASFLLNHDGTFCQSLFYTPFVDAKPFNPLQKIVDDAAWEMSKKGQMYTITIREAGAVPSPLTVTYIQMLLEWSYIVGWEWNVRDNVKKLRLIKREYREIN